MTRISKQARKRAVSPRKRQANLAQKTGSRKDNLPEGFKNHSNAIDGELAGSMFIPKIK